MRILSEKTQIDFMGKRKFAVVLSAVLIITSLASLFTRGLSFGIDFTGGTLIEEMRHAFGGGMGTMGGSEALARVCAARVD